MVENKEKLRSAAALYPCKYRSGIIEAVYDKEVLE